MADYPPPLAPERLLALRILAIALAAGAFFIVVPLWLPLVLAAWTADLAAPLLRRLERLLGGRRRGAAAALTLLAFAVMTPLALLTHKVISDGALLFDQVRAALATNGSLGHLVDGSAGRPGWTLDEWAALAGRYGASAWQALAVVARTSARAFVGVLVYTVALFGIAASGGEAWAFLERALPLDREDLERFASAFRETGRGLVVGAGGTALAQGVIATVAYAIVGVPNPLVLGALTAVCALVPFIGTALIWVPLAVQLALGGSVGRAIGLAIVGVAVIGTVDNVLRPLLTRYGKLKLPGAVVLFAIVGGVAALGPTGALLGPIVVRLTFEALAILRERTAARAG